MNLEIRQYVQPSAIRGDRGNALAFGEREAGAIPERQASMTRKRPEFAGALRKRQIEVRDGNAETENCVPRFTPRRSTIDELRSDFGIIDRRHQRTAEKRHD